MSSPANILSRRVFLGASGAFAFVHPARAATPIDESGFVRIGGIEQWIAIQGSDTANPAILYLHGGPGESQSPFLSQFLPWEKDFTVVNWDQRGAGKTYERNGKEMPAFTLDRLADDAIELARYVSKRLGKKKLILVGQSFGAMLGLMVARRAPELFCAFVGTGQFVNTPLTTTWREKWARQQALASNDTEGLAALDAAAKLPFTSSQRTQVSRKWVMTPPDQAYLKIQSDFAGTREHPTAEGKSWVEAYLFEAHNVGKESAAFDAMTDAVTLPVPYILIQGREDQVTPFVPAKAYFDTVRSKGKVFVPIDGGHYACFTNPAAFVGALREHARPLAL